MQFSSWQHKESALICIIGGQNYWSGSCRVCRTCSAAPAHATEIDTGIPTAWDTVMINVGLAPISACVKYLCFTVHRVTHISPCKALAM